MRVCEWHCVKLQSMVLHGYNRAKNWARCLVHAVRGSHAAVPWAEAVPPPQCCSSTRLSPESMDLPGRKVCCALHQPSPLHACKLPQTHPRDSKCPETSRWPSPAPRSVCYSPARRAAAGEEEEEGAEEGAQRLTAPGCRSGLANVYAHELVVLRAWVPPNNAKQPLVGCMRSCQLLM